MHAFIAAQMRSMPLRTSCSLRDAHSLRIMISAMLAFSLAPRRVQRPIANEPMRGLADISYTIYLIHFAVIWFALRELSLPQTGSAWSAMVLVSK